MIVRIVGLMKDVNTKENSEEMNWMMFELLVHELAEKIKKSNIRIQSVFGISRGGLPIAIRLSHILNISYSTIDLISPKTLITDDVADSGHTLTVYKERFPLSPTATLIWKTTSIFKPDFYAIEKSTPNWIIFPWEMK